MSLKSVFVNLFFAAATVLSSPAFGQKTEVLPTPQGTPQAAASGEDALGPWAIDNAASGVAMRTGHGNRQHTVYLRFDGNLTGRVSRFLVSGEFVPAQQVKVCLVRDSVIAASTHSNDEGAFQIVDLEPGVYWVIAAGDDGYTAFSVRVLAHDDVAEQRLWLHMTLVPRSTIDLLNDLLGERKVTTAMLACPAVCQGTGGGRGGAALLGLAGLAGLTGITGEASPATP